MLYENSCFSSIIKPRPAKMFVYRFEFLSPFLFYEEQGQRRKEKSDGGDEPALSARTSRDTVPTAPSRADLAPPSTPRSRYVPGGSNSPIPRSARILKGSVVNICLPRHSNFVIGERLWRPVRIRNRALYCSACPIIAVLLSEIFCLREKADVRKKPSPPGERFLSA